VLAEDKLNDMSWFQQLEKLPANADAPPYHVLASNDFQEGLKTHRDLRFLQRNSSSGRRASCVRHARSRQARYEGTPACPSARR
jgi:hypothetical protein